VGFFSRFLVHESLKKTLTLRLLDAQPKHSGMLIIMAIILILERFLGHISVSPALACPILTFW
jgi:hypothetical protein